MVGQGGQAAEKASCAMSVLLHRKVQVARSAFVALACPLSKDLPCCRTPCVISFNAKRYKQRLAQRY